jgi:predicted lipoprotein with Yx(FWY)xxD motif
MKTLITTMVLVLGATSVFAQEKPVDPIDAVPALTREVQNNEKEVLLADSFGKTLYTFDLDLGSGTSRCKGDCAEVWPPYILTDEEKAHLALPFGAIERSNRKLQLTYDGQPVYTYIFDRAMGDDKGDNIGGVWHYIELEKTNTEGPALK